MGMNVGSGGGDGDGEILSAINTTPLVDVMLVLLIIFLITIPVITKTVKLDLPKASNIATVTKPENITIAVDQRGNIYWKESLVPNQQALGDLIRKAAVVVPQPEIHVRGRPERALRIRRACAPDAAERRHPEGRLHFRTKSRESLAAPGRSGRQRQIRWVCR